MTPVENVKLVCAVHGEAAVTVSVVVARDAEVSTLQALIADELSSNEYVVPPRLLALYLARKDGKWLQEDDALLERLRGEFDEHEFPRIESTWQLNDDDCLGSDFTPGRQEIQVLVKAQSAAEAAAKRRRVGWLDTTLAALWKCSQWSAKSSLPSPHEVAEILQRPLPFRLALHDATVASGVFDQRGPLVMCHEMEVRMDVFVLRCGCKVVSQSALYDSLFTISTSMCSARDMWFERDQTVHDDDIYVCMQNMFQYKGLVVMRGDENTALVKQNKTLQKFQDKMPRWNDKLYGDLPYILGYVTSGDDLHLFAIEKPANGSSVGPCRYTTIAELNIVEHKATALTLFYKLGILIYQMASTATREGLDFHACGVQPLADEDQVVCSACGRDLDDRGVGQSD